MLNELVSFEDGSRLTFNWSKIFNSNFINIQFGILKQFSLTMVSRQRQGHWPLWLVWQKQNDYAEPKQSNAKKENKSIHL